MGRPPRAARSRQEAAGRPPGAAGMPRKPPGGRLEAAGSRQEPLGAGAAGSGRPECSASAQSSPRRPQERKIQRKRRPGG